MLEPRIPSLAEPSRMNHDPDAPVQRALEDGCSGCNYSEVYCSCVLWIDGLPCCDNCSHKVSDPATAVTVRGRGQTF